MRFTAGMLAISLALLCVAHPVMAVDNSLYAGVLQRYVKDGLVDYAGLKADRADLDAYLDMLSKVDSRELSREEQMAFYINLYNAATMQLIVDNYPKIKSIKALGGFFSSPWKLEVVRLNGEMVTLDHIEHGILRPDFQDERVHVALNCSAVSCPPLQPVPFEGKSLELQLEKATIAFVNNSESNYLDGKKLYVSKIFKWFSEDFPIDLVGWFSDYAQGDLKARLVEFEEKDERPRIKYLDYNWDLNDYNRRTQ